MHVVSLYSSLFHSNSVYINVPLAAAFSMTDPYFIRAAFQEKWRTWMKWDLLAWQVIYGHTGAALLACFSTKGGEIRRGWVPLSQVYSVSISDVSRNLAPEIPPCWKLVEYPTDSADSVLIQYWFSTDSVLKVTESYWKLLKVTESYWKLLVTLSPVWNCVLSKVSWWVPVRTNGYCEDMCILGLWRWHGSQQPALKPGLYGQNLVYGAEFQQGASRFCCEEIWIGTGI